MSNYTTYVCDNCGTETECQCSKNEDGGPEYDLIRYECAVCDTWLCEDCEVFTCEEYGCKAVMCCKHDTSVFYDAEEASHYCPKHIDAARADAKSELEHENAAMLETGADRCPVRE